MTNKANLCFFQAAMLGTAGATRLLLRQRRRCRSIQGGIDGDRINLTLRHVFLAVFTSWLVAVVAGCGGNEATTPAPVPTVTGVSLSATSIPLLVGQTHQLTASVTTTLNAPTTVTWSSENSTIASVDANGLVSGRTAGTTPVTATSSFDATRKATATVVVTVPVASITISSTPTNFVTGQTAQLSAVAKDSTGAVLLGRSISWASADPSVASVSATALVTARTPGTTTVSASADGKVGVATVTVVALTPLFREAGVPVGGRRGTISLLGPEEIVFSETDLRQMGALPMPDEHQTYLTFNDGVSRFWLVGGNGTTLFTTTDFRAFTTTLSSGRVTTTFGPAGPLSSAYDADYAGAGSVFPAANGKDLLMLYHGENHYGKGYSATGATAFYAGVGLARSTDKGLTWTRQGAVITGRDPQPPYPPDDVGLGAMNPSVLVTGGYLYATFGDAVTKNGTFKGNGQQCLARAPISSDGSVGSWMKLYRGSYSQPGLGGLCESPIPPPPAASGITFVINGELSFNTALNSYVMAFLGDDGFFYSTSQDMVVWTKPEVLLKTPPRIVSLKTPAAPYYYYPTLISPSSPSDQITGTDGYLYYAKGIQTASLGQNTHIWVRQRFVVTP